MVSSWERPENVPFPSIWSRFEGKKEIDGKIPKFWVQDIPENMFDIATDIMFKNYIYEEPLCKFCNILDDQESLDEVRTIWRNVLDFQLGLICFMKNPDPNGEPIIAGVNMTYPSVKDEPHPKRKGKKWSKITDTVLYVCQLKDPYKMLGINEYMNALGLSVLPEFRGQGVGEELLKARFPLCKAVGLKATLTVYTATASQKLAERVGFKDIVCITYDELKDKNSRFDFPGISEHIKESWKRPENVPYPSVWKRFDGKREINGKIPKFWIQDVPEDMIEKVGDFMFSNYIYEEPLSKYSNFVSDPESMEEGKQGWSMLASGKTALVCFMENPEAGGEPIIAGMNVTFVKAKNDPNLEFKGKKLRNLIDTVEYLYKQKDTFELAGANEYLNAAGLSVLPEYRGQGIGEQLLLARTPLCKAIGLKATFTIFSSITSQKLAGKTGFKDVLSIPYDDLPKIDPRFSYPGITEHTKNIKLMYKLID